jgi:hypothetical protein
MKIELLKQYGMAGPGEILNPSPVIAGMLIKRKIAKAIVPKKKKAKKCSSGK